MTNKQILLNHLSDSKMILNDGFSLTWLRISHQDLIDKHNLGGGNFLITLGSFATLNFVSKIYWIINNDLPEPLKEEELNLIKSKINDLPSSLRDSVEIKSSLKINETEAFIKLIDWYNTTSPDNSLGLKNRQDSELVWKGLRNALAHMGFPKKGFSLQVFLGDPIPISEIETTVLRLLLSDYNRTGPAVIVNHRKYDFLKICQPDVLVVEAEKIIALLINEISSRREDDKGVKNCIDWINNMNS